MGNTTDKNHSESILTLNKFCDISEIYHPYQQNTRFYSIADIKNRTVTFSCLHNFHLESGDLVHHCGHGGMWSGSVPVCKVDYYKEKYRLSLFILLVSLVIPVLGLGVDFYHYWHRRRRQRAVFFRRFVSFSDNPRITVPHSRLDINTVQDAFQGAVALDDDIFAAFSGRRKSGYSDTPYFSDYAALHFPLRSSIRPGYQGRVWYEPTRKNSSNANVSMFGAAGHLAKIGRRLWNH